MILCIGRHCHCDIGHFVEQPLCQKAQEARYIPLQRCSILARNWIISADFLIRHLPVLGCEHVQTRFHHVWGHSFRFLGNYILGFGGILHSEYKTKQLFCCLDERTCCLKPQLRRNRSSAKPPCLSKWDPGANSGQWQPIKGYIYIIRGRKIHGSVWLWGRTCHNLLNSPV